jgi:peroxiredoxin
MQKLEETVVRLLAEPAPKKAVLQPRELEVAPALSLTDLTGKKVNLKDISGRPLVVNFFNAGTADWAGAVLAKLHQDYAGRGLEVIGVNLFDEDASIKECIAKYSIKFPILRGDEITQRAWIGGGDAWATFFVNSDGTIVKRITNSINNGLEEPVFRKYAEYLLPKAKSGPSR